MAETATKRWNLEESNRRPMTFPEIENLVRKGTKKPNLDLVQPQKLTPPRRDFETGFGLIDQAAFALEGLVARCQQLQNDLTEITDRARSEASSQQETIEEWKNLASEFKTNAEQTGEKLEEMKARCEAAEGRAQALQEACEAAGRRASTAEEVIAAVYDKISSTFGVGSTLHSTLSALGNSRS